MIQIILLGLVAISGISCVIESEARAHPLDGYVLEDASGQVVGNSGVRIGPLDFGLTNREMLVKYGIPEPLIQNFTTYLGLTGTPAVEALKRTPLTLTQEELTIIEDKFVQYWKPRFLKLSQAIRDSPLVYNISKI
jgi:hypothetical protein